MKSEKGTNAHTLELFVKTFLPKKKKFTLQETQVLADIMKGAGRGADFNKVHELAMTFFSEKAELTEKEARVLAKFLLCGGPSKSQENRITNLFKGQNYCTINQLIDAINNVKLDSESIFYGPVVTDGNGNSIETYLLEGGEDRHFTLGRDGINQVLKEYNG